MLLQGEPIMRIAMYPGTFDPITYGHLDIIERAAKMYDILYVAIMKNPNKKCEFSEEERKHLIEKCVKDMPNVRVVIGQGLTIDLARKLECQALVRGIRAVVDYEYELSLATSNMRVNPTIETVFLVSKPEYSFLSSSIAKEVAQYGGDITSFIPSAIHEDVLDRLRKND